jgi:hypothetical protein
VSTMAEAPLASTAAQLAAVGAELKQVRAQLANAQKHERGTVDIARRRQAVTLYVLSGNSVAAPAAYLGGRRSKRSWPGQCACEDMWKRHVEDWYLGETVEDVMALGSPLSLRGRRVLRRARVFHVEFALAEYVQRANEDRGHAPRTEELRRKARSVWDGHSTFVVAGGPAPNAWQSKQRFAVWACRWRKRWAGRVGALQQREHIPVSVRRAKACSDKCIPLLLWGSG